jgi:class 3 adenylate cyclase
MEIPAWLRLIGLPQYEADFREAAIDFDILQELTDADLEKIGVVLERMLKAIGELKAAGRRPSPPEATHAQGEASDSAERRLLTVLFCDLVDSTSLGARLDPEGYSEVIQSYQACVTRIIERFDGFVAKYMGDGALSYFGYPRAHEDDAERAVRAGLELITQVQTLTTPSTAPLGCRVGIATGDVVVGQLIGKGEARERNVVGETPNLAARLQAVAETNTVLTDSATRRLLRGLFDCRDIGVVELKGITGGAKAWQVLAPSTLVSRFEALHPTQLTPLVGREEELDLLIRRWRKTEQGSGQVAMISAEAGIGKSRLVASFQERIGLESGRMVSLQCSPHHQDSALYPVVGYLEHTAGFGRSDDQGAKFKKLTANLSDLVSDPERLHLMADLLSVTGPTSPTILGLSPQARRQRIIGTLADYFGHLARAHSILIVIEDIHWIDPSTRLLLEALVERTTSSRHMLVLTFRPEFRPPWTGQPQVMSLFSQSARPP